MVRPLGCCASRVDDDHTPGPNTVATDSRPASSTNHAVAAAHPLPASGRTQAALRKEKPWRSNSRSWSHADLQRERNIFWETQVSGRQEVWSAVRAAVEMARDHNDLQGAKAVLDASGCTLSTDRLSEGIWDERGNLYKLHRWVVSDPVNVVAAVDGADDTHDLDEDGGDDEDDIHDDPELKDRDPQHSREDKGKDRLTAGHSVKARLSDRAVDIDMTVDLDAPIKRIINRIHAETGIAATTPLRVAYLGKVLNENETLKSHDFQPGHVISVLVLA